MNMIDDDFIKLVFQTLENNNSIFTQINNSMSDIKELLQQYNNSVEDNIALDELESRLIEIKQLLDQTKSNKIIDISEQLDDKFKSFGLWISGCLLVLGLIVVFSISFI